MHINNPARKALIQTTTIDYFMQKRFRQLLYCIVFFGVALVGNTGITKAATGIAYAVDRTVKGKVVSDNGEELIGATVLLKGTNVGVVTDVEGNYSIQVPDQGGVLTVSFIGYLPKEVQIGNASILNITLQTDAKALEEVVVVGYGTQLKSEVTTAISTVKADQITQTPVQRVEQALQGRVAGVQVTNVSGQPGDLPTVRIRGIGTNGDASPLYIVDGFQVGGIDFLNPADIESMDVLKDAASAAIYGARGANGVVIITTRSGNKDGKMNVSYDGYYGIQNAWRNMNLLDAREYVVMMNEGAANSNNSLPFPDVSPYPPGTGTDWQFALFQQNAPMSNHQIAVTGGTQKNSYAATLSMFDQNGIVGGDKSNFKRYTARVNSDNQVTKFLKFGTSFAYSHINRRAIDPNQEFGGLLNNAINLDPLTPVYETDPNRLAGYNVNAVRDSEGRTYGISRFVAQEVVNPLARLEVLNGTTRVDKLVGNVYADLQLLPGLSLRSTFNVDLGFVTGTNFNPIYYLNAAQGNTRSLVSKSVDRFYTWQQENVFTYQKTFGSHSFNFNLGNTARKEMGEGLFGSNTGLVTTDPNRAYLNLATDTQTAVAAGGAGENALLSLFGRVNYGFKGKYLFSATLRRDGSSRFGSETRFGTFPSVSAGWVLSEESFMENISAINFAKVRASWGQNGNDKIGNYPWAAIIGTGRGYTFGNGYISGATTAFVPNPFLQWETSEQTNIGLDLAFMNNALTVTADYYIKTTKGWLLNAPIPGTVGIPAGTVNGGSVRNSGIELALNYQGRINKLGYSFGLNGSFNKNEVTEINNAQGILAGASISTYGQVSRSTIGEPFAYFYGYKTDGIFQNVSEIENYTANGTRIQPNAVPGDVRFVDLNGDGKIDAEDRTKIGNPTPKVTAGFTFGFDYGNFDLNGFFNGAFGNQIFNGTRRYDLVRSNMQTKFLGRWTGEGTSNELPRFTWSDTNGNWTNISENYLEPGDFVRLKTLQLGWTLKKSGLEKLHMNKVRVYVSADNLITLTKYTGFDPEIGARSSLDIGIDRGIYPQARTYRVGVSLTL